MTPDQRYKTQNPKIISETIDGETIIINLDSGHYFSLNPTGGAISSGILAQRTAAEIIQGLVAEYHGDETAMATEVGKFLDHLQKEGLVSPMDSPGGVPFAPVRAAVEKSKTFEAPSFQKYEDMQDLLLL